MTGRQHTMKMESCNSIGIAPVMYSAVWLDFIWNSIRRCGGERESINYSKCHLPIYVTNTTPISPISSLSSYRCSLINNVFFFFFTLAYTTIWGFPGSVLVKNPPGLSWWLRCQQFKRPGFDPGIRKIPWRREWLPTVVFLPEKSHGQRSLVGYSPWDHKDSDTT